MTSPLFTDDGGVVFSGITTVLSPGTVLCFAQQAEIGLHPVSLPVAVREMLIRVVVVVIVAGANSV